MREKREVFQKQREVRSGLNIVKIIVGAKRKRTALAVLFFKIEVEITELERSLPASPSVPWLR